MLKKHSIKQVILVLTPTTDLNIQLHDQNFPGIKWSKIRSDLRKTLKGLKITFVNHSESLSEYSLFSDSYHLNASGNAVFTEILANDLNRILAAKEPIGR